MAPQPQSAWDQLAASAQSGELFLDDSAKTDILAACAELETELLRITRDLQDLRRVGRFSDLPSGKHFDDLFQAKIFTGDASVTGRIQQMIGEARKMRHVFERSFHNYRNSDQATRDRLTQLGKQVQP